MRIPVWTALFCLMSGLAAHGADRGKEQPEVGPDRIKAPMGLNDGDARNPVTNPRRDQSLSECFRGVKPLKSADPRGPALLKRKKRDRPEPLRISFGPGGAEAIAAANARRRADALKDHRVASTYEGTDWNSPQDADIGVDLKVDEARRSIVGVWTPRHQVPPYFKIYELPLNSSKVIEFVEVRGTDVPGVALVEGYGAGYDAPYRMIVGPYCWRDASSREEPKSSP